MTTKKVKIALVGAGYVAEVAHLPAYASHPAVELVAVVEEDPVRRNKIKKAFGFKRGYEDFTRMLSREDVDAVDICTPNYLHAPMAIAALRSGRHVLCEKPLARNATEGKKMVDMAKESGKMLMVAMNNRFRRDVNLLKTFVKRGELGGVQLVKVGWQRIARDWKQRRWFTDQRMAGGGALLDLGLPLMDLAIWISGLKKPMRASCNVFGRSGKRGVEDSACAMINFAGGACLILEVTWNLLEPKDNSYLEIYGSQGGASLHPLKVHKAMHGHLVNVTPNIDDVRHYYRESYQAEINHFVDCVQKKKRPLATGRDALKVLKILDAMYESEATGREVTFTS